MGNHEDHSTDFLAEPLTRREREVLALLADGLTSPEIAERLTLALSSVKTHIQHLYGKLGVNGKRQAVKRASELGLLKPDSIVPQVLPSAPPSAQPKPSTAGYNLPLQLTSFIGREREVTDVQRLLSTTRLVTLTGAGGTGKTRLALQAAAELVDHFPDGIWMVELAPIAEAVLVPQAVAQALALRTETVDSFGAAPVDHSSHDIVSLIIDHLRSKSLLLILDNCEHLVRACAELTEQLLRALPRLHILTTSREALGIGGEQSYPVPGMSVPEVGESLVLETAAESDAVQLFLERARAGRPDFALTDATAPAVVRICQQLDGNPLAIELAAARVRALSVEQIAALLENRFRLLKGGSRTAPLRQQTLRGTIDWSYELLEGDERTLFRRLAVFAGGWTLEAATHVMAESEVIDLLTQLVGKSLVVSTQPPQQDVRFSMPETIREYAQEKLEESGEAHSISERHFAYYVALAEEAEPELRGRAQVKWLNRLDQERDNLRAAFAWAIKREDAERVVQLAGALTYYWSIRNVDEGRRWLETALDQQTSHGSLKPSLWQARVLLGAGSLRWWEDVNVRRSRLEKGLAMYRELGDKAGIAYGLSLLGQLTGEIQKDCTKALELLQEALELWTEAEDEWGIGLCLYGMGFMMEGMGDHDKAREFYQSSAEKFRQQGDRWQLLGPLWGLARYYFASGDIARSRAFSEENLAAYKQLGPTDNIITPLNWLTYTSIVVGNYAEARVTALNMQDPMKNPMEIAAGRVYLGQIDLLQGRPAEAQIHFEATLKMLWDPNDEWATGLAINWVQPWLASAAYHLGDLERAKTLLHESVELKSPDQDHHEIRHALLVRGDVALAEGDAMAAEYYARSLRVIVQNNVKWDVAARLERFAQLAAAAQQPQRAARLLGAAAALREQMSTPIPPIERADSDDLMTQTRAQLNPARFDVAWAEGRAMSWEQAAAYALNEIEI